MLGDKLGETGPHPSSHKTVQSRDVVHALEDRNSMVELATVDSGIGSTRSSRISNQWEATELDSGFRELQGRVDEVQFAAGMAHTNSQLNFVL